MNPRDRKRHEQRKARQQAAAGRQVPAWATEPELRGTRMAVLPLEDGGQVRRLELDAEDPLPVVVRWCRRALLEAAPDECLRVLTVKNWNEDERELLHIPEARAYFRRLWFEGRPLLRLLSESTWAPLPDDSHGLPGEVLSSLGMGWLDVYLAAFCDVVEQERIEGQYGPVYSVGMRGIDDESRHRLRSELLEATDDNPGGLAWDAVAARTRLMEQHKPALAHTAAELERAGRTDWVAIVCSLLDEIGRELMVRLYGGQAVREHLERCRRDNLEPAAVVSAPRVAMAEVLEPFAPGAARTLAEQLPAGELWVVSIAGGGTQVGRLKVSEDATS
jgi:hypothetical protein